MGFSQCLNFSQICRRVEGDFRMADLCALFFFHSRGPPIVMSQGPLFFMQSMALAENALIWDFYFGKPGKPGKLNGASRARSRALAHQPLRWTPDTGGPKAAQSEIACCPLVRSNSSDKRSNKTILPKSLMQLKKKTGKKKNSVSEMDTYIVDE